jgi:hypothetical protein
MNFRKIYKWFWMNLDWIIKNSKLSEWIVKIPLKIGLQVEFLKTQWLICKGRVTCSLDCGLIFRKRPMVVNRELILLKFRGSFVKCYFRWRGLTWGRRFEDPMAEIFRWCGPSGCARWYITLIYSNCCRTRVGLIAIVLYLLII